MDPRSVHISHQPELPGLMTPGWLNESTQPSPRVILSSCVANLDPRDNPRKRGNTLQRTPLFRGLGHGDWVSLTRFRNFRVLHLAEIVAPKVKTSTTDEEVCFYYF